MTRTPGSDVDAPASSHPLSPREAEALLMVATYGDHEQAANHMGIARQTLRNHLTMAYVKLNVTGTIQAFRALGWLCLPKGLA